MYKVNFLRFIGFLAQSRPWSLALIGLTALLLRLVYIEEIETSPLFAVPVVDAMTYAEDALYLSGESWLGRPAPFWQPPLYPYILALGFGLWGENYYLPRLFQALLGAAICLLTYLVGRRLFSPYIALGAGLGAALYGPLIYFGGELLPTTGAIFLNLLLLLALLRSGSGQGWWFLAGLLLGLSALAVANILLVLCFLLLWLWRWSEQDFRLRQGLLLLLGCALVIAPVTLRNYLVGGDLVLISHNAGINFYIGNNPQYEHTVHIRPGRDWVELVEMPEQMAGIEKPSEKSRFFFARAADFIAAEPLAYLRLLGRKIYNFWHGDERLRNLDPYYARNDSTVLSLLLWKYALAFPFGLVAPLALLGLGAFWARPEGRSPEGRLLILFLLAYAFSVILFFVTSRYRLPAVPLLLLFAGYGLWFLCRSSHRLRSLLIVIALLVTANRGAGTMDMSGEANQHLWLGYAYEQKSMLANAMRHYRTALQRQPDHEDAHLRLAALYTQQGKDAKAIAAYRKFIQIHPEAEMARFLLGNAYLQARNYQDAIDAYTSLVPLRPQWAALHGRLAYTYLMAGKPTEAAASYRQTLTINPDSSLVRYQLARLYESQNNREAAIAEYRTLLAEGGENAEYYTQLATNLVSQAGLGKEGVWLEQTPQTLEAEALLRTAIRLEPDLDKPRKRLGMLLARLQRDEEAIELFEVLHSRPKPDYRVHLHLWHLYKRIGKKEKAAEHLTLYESGRKEQRLQQLAASEMEKQLEQILRKRPN